MSETAEVWLEVENLLQLVLGGAIMLSLLFCGRYVLSFLPIPLRPGKAARPK